MSLDALLARLQSDHRQRLRWRVLRLAGLRPGSREWRRISDADCLLWGLHLLLDMGEYSPAFDMERFAALREGAP